MLEELKPGLVLTLEDGIVLHSLPDQDVYYAFSVINGDQYKLNKTSYWVLETISDGIEWGQLLDNFISTFDVAKDHGESDLKKLIDELHNQKIIGRKDDVENKNSL